MLRVSICSRHFLHQGGGRILLGDNIGGGALTLSQIKFQFVGAPISNGPPLYKCILDHMYIKFRLSPHLLEWNYCVNLCVSVVQAPLILLFTES